MKDHGHKMRDVVDSQIFGTSCWIIDMSLGLLLRKYGFLKGLATIIKLLIVQSVKKTMIKNSSIKIGVKIKPTTSDKQVIIQSTADGNPPSLIMNIGGEAKKFEVDAIHDANTSTKTMFKDLSIDKIVEKFINGFNVTVMAYGQTGAGKTYCMEGNSDEPGIIVDSIQSIFKALGSDAEITCSFMQLYNEKIYDLLIDDANIDSLKLRWEIDREFVVDNLTVHQVRSANELEKMWKKGTKNRIVASNKIHDLSSRSHALFIVSINDRDEDNNIRIRQMTFVDLAGSERLFDHLGKLSKESIQINKSLFALRKVIKVLEEATVHKKELYVPYRDSKLTSLLKKALGGNCLTMMIACIDSVQEHRDQTLLTLSYAISTGRIQNSAHVNIDYHALENKNLKLENEKLKKQLETAWKQIDLLHKKEKFESEKKPNGQFSHKIIECIGTIRELIKSNKQLREDLEEERRIKRQQKLEIEMLMEERYMLKKQNSLGQSPSPRRKVQHSSRLQSNVQEYSPSLMEKTQRIVARQEFVPKKEKLLRIRQVVCSNSMSPDKNLNATTASSSKQTKKTTSVTKRTRYIYRTEPDQLQVDFQLPKGGKGVYEKMSKY